MKALDRLLEGLSGGLVACLRHGIGCALVLYLNFKILQAILQLLQIWHGLFDSFKLLGCHFGTILRSKILFLSIRLLILCFGSLEVFEGLSDDTSICFVYCDIDVGLELLKLLLLELVHGNFRDRIKDHHLRHLSRYFIVDGHEFENVALSLLDVYIAEQNVMLILLVQTFACLSTDFEQFFNPSVDILKDESFRVGP